MALMIFTAIILIFVVVLMFFHCYISCCVNTTTYSLSFKPKVEGPKKEKEFQINLWEAGGPVSGERLRREEGKILY